MNKKLLSCLIAGVLGVTLAASSPAFARGGGGGGHGGGGHGGGGHFGGMGGMHSGGMRGGMNFSGGRFAGAPFARAALVRPGLSPRFSGAAFRSRFVHHRFHHRFHRFAFIGAPYVYAAYDGCWRRVWTPYGVRWVDVCGAY